MDIDAQKLTEIEDEIYEKYSEKFSKLGAKIGVDLRNKLIELGIPENEVFYHPTSTIISRLLENSLMTPMGSGINYGVLTGQTDPDKLED